MQKKRATLWLNAALFLAVAALGYGLTIYFDGAAMPARAETEITPLPDFSFTDMSGKTRSVQYFKNKIVIINFWATWCAPCVVEFPALLKIAADNKDDVVLIALSSDAKEDDIKKFLQQQKAPTDNVFIAHDREDVTLKIFGVSQLPETVITDRDLNIREKLIGAEWETAMLQKIIDSL
ncbi:MAG: TlpA family protein disulfide reductase [Alphaproteobacteria bacterium]|jgi:thiol-disulfide isomerase/thioredoxin|nr:TlpA family protein disulfide reductase [Alphaproteobacteria bacterium]